MPTPPETVSLAAIGFDDQVEAQFAATAPPNSIPGRISRVDRGSSVVLLDGDTTRAEVSPTLQRQANAGDPAAMPAVGDWVAITRRPQHTYDAIEVILERTSAFIRRASEAHGDVDGPGRPQVMAANVDVAFLVASATDVRAGRLERAGVAAWESGARPVIVLTKADLVSDTGPAFRMAEEAVPDTPVHLVDGVHGDGIEAIRAYLTMDGVGGKTAVFLGASGVGKSTLTNALIGAHVVDTGAVRAGDGRGRHTTTARHLVPLPGGGALIDTPGIRSIATWGASEGIDIVFAEIDALALECRFRDCSHMREPDCAVLAAVASGELELARLERFRRVERERAFEARKADPAATEAQQATGKRINRWLRARPDVQRKRGKSQS